MQFRVLCFRTLLGLGFFLISLPVSAFFSQSIETEDIIQKYGSGKKVKILIVPGHDSYYSGAHFNGVDEAELNLALSTELYRLLKKEKGIEVAVVRDKKGYASFIEKYMGKHGEAVAKWRTKKMKEMQTLMAKGKVKSYVHVAHNTALPEVVETLYSINKYANDNNYDLVIHIHFNDYAGRWGADGLYTGFAIYVPEKQYSNAEASKDLAEKIRNQLYLVSGESTLPEEDAITADQELIAIGRYDTLDAAVSLIEYGYIYESRFTDKGIGKTVLNELAAQTYRGIMAYVEDSATEKKTYQALDAISWSKAFKDGDHGLSVLALQDTLRDLGYYPHKVTLSECPLSGIYNGCTEDALEAFQKAKKLRVTGGLDSATQRALTKARGR